jgi:hypothetical protein
MVIFSLANKRNVVIALMAVAIINSATADQSARNSMDNEQKRGYLAAVYHKIGAFVIDSKKRVDNFFDTKNKESFSLHVENLSKELERVEAEIIMPIRGALTQETVQDDLYIQIVRKTDEIISELHSNLKVLHSALSAQRNNKNAKSVIDALKIVEAKVASRMVSL